MVAVWGRCWGIIMISGILQLPPGAALHMQMHDKNCDVMVC